MKLLLCVHGYPPEEVGGTELATRRLAHGLARRGHQVLVLAGATARADSSEADVSEERDELEGSSVRVLRCRRPDLFFDHWHKSKSARVARRFRTLLADERPDLVHVQHWLRLTRDLVFQAAASRVPAVVSLHDAFVSCPLVLRVEPRERSACALEPAAPSCVPCAGRVPPRTPWVPMDGGFLAFAQRQQDLLRELRLARGLLVPTRAFGERQLAWLGASELEFEVLPPAAAPRLGGRSEPRHGPLRVASWGRLSTLKGTELLFEALDGLEVEAELAGEEERPGFLDGLRRRHPGARIRVHGAYEAERLHEHPVADAQLSVITSRAPESYGLVLDEARALGMPALVPDGGAFAARGGEERGAPTYAAGDAADLRRRLRALASDPAALEALRRAVPAPPTEAEVVDGHLACYERARAAGAPEVPLGEWYAERMTDFEEERWDASLAAADPRELGLEAAGAEEGAP